MLEIATPQLVTGPQQVDLPAQAESHVTFHQILSALNPLQYIPVVGTIYRAVTGDEIPEPVRRIGSLIASFLMGGPVGALINVGMFAAEKLTGFDIDKTGQAALHGGLPGATPSVPAVASSTPGPAQTAMIAPAQIAGPDLSAPLVFASVGALPSGPASAPASAEAWSPAQLAAYGVSTTGDGALKLADLRGADVLNSLELTRVQMVRSAYDRATSLTH